MQFSLIFHEADDKITLLSLFVDAVPQQENHVVDRSPPQPEEEDEAEVYNPPPEEVVDEEQPVPEVINEVPNNVAPVAATTVAPVLQEEAPKKSYASIVGFRNQLPHVLNSFAAYMHLRLFMDDAVLAILFITLFYMLCNFSSHVHGLKINASQFQYLLLHMNS